ncbi:MAG TPA: PBP1A family penicillin-binding protein [Spirochaetota bacterium]|nr:PBP1A family penicillin-binding protein [Spirochaetota bacterium]
MKTRNIIIYILLSLLVLLPFAYTVYAYSAGCRAFSESGDLNQPLPTKLYDRNGELISELYDEYREYVKFSDIPETVIKSFLAAEDSSFFMHTGFDVAGILRAIIIDIASGEMKQGGSTITQQLVKQIYTGREKSIKRKLVELFISREFEKRYTKTEILEMYLNRIYMGHGVYGIAAASDFYFGKGLNELNTAEATLLAGIPSAPDRFSPLKNPQNSHDRTQAIIFNLIASGYISRTDAAAQFNEMWEVLSEKIKTEFPEAGIRRESRDRAPWLTEYVRRELITKYGEDAVYRGGMKVMTTIDLSYQGISDSLITSSLLSQNRISAGYNRSRLWKLEALIATKSLPANEKKSLKSETMKTAVRLNRELINSISDELEIISLVSALPAIEKQVSGHIEYYEKLMARAKVEGALVAIDPRTGEILAITGGSEFNPVNQLNRAAQSRRQPGSAFKAFVYGAGIESGAINAATSLQDSPVYYGSSRKTWSPSNYDKDYSGRVLVRKALALSLNIVSAKVYDLAGGAKIADFASRMTGVQKERFQVDPTLSLGTSELTPLEIASGFGSLANKGVLIPAHAINKIEDRYGREIFNAETIKPVKATDEKTAFIMTNMMRDVIESGTASYAVKKAAGFRLPCAGKTGTNTGFRDAWFIGYTPDLVAAVWVGCDSPEYSLGSGQSGSVAAAPVWGKFMAEVYRTRERKAFPDKPAGVVKKDICSITGSIPDRGCPTRKEFFISGFEPAEKCDGLHGRLSNINELVKKGKKKMSPEEGTTLFSDETPEEKFEEESFFFD